MLVFVNGVPTAGKSTVCRGLAARGYEAVDTDTVAVWRDKAHRSVVHPTGGAEREPGWFDYHDWVVERAVVEDLAARANEMPIFVCGSLANEDELWDLFDVVVHLAVDEVTLRGRIATRDPGEFGTRPHELESVLGWLATAVDDNRDFGAVVVDATQPLDAVVEEVIRAAVDAGPP